MKTENQRAMLSTLRDFGHYAAANELEWRLLRIQAVHDAIYDDMAFDRRELLRREWPELFDVIDQLWSTTPIL